MPSERMKRRPLDFLGPAQRKVGAAVCAAIMAIGLPGCSQGREPAVETTSVTATPTPSPETSVAHESDSIDEELKPIFNPEGKDSPDYDPKNPNNFEISETTLTYEQMNHMSAEAFVEKTTPADRVLFWVESVYQIIKPGKLGNETPEEYLESLDKPYNPHLEAGGMPPETHTDATLRLATYVSDPELAAKLTTCSDYLTKNPYTGEILPGIEATMDYIKEDKKRGEDSVGIASYLHTASWEPVETVSSENRKDVPYLDIGDKFHYVVFDKLDEEGNIKYRLKTPIIPVAVHTKHGDFYVPMQSWSEQIDSSDSDIDK